MKADDPSLPGSLEGFLGLRNVQRDVRLPAGALVLAENMLLDDTGALASRDGYALALAISGSTDAFAHPEGDSLLVVAQGMLFRITADLEVTVVASGLQDETLVYGYFGDRIFYAGEFDAGLVLNNGEWQPLRLPVPPQPTLAWGPLGGLLPPGQYQVAAVYRHLQSGLQSGASPVLRVELTALGSFAVEVAPLAGHAYDLYVSSANGTVLYWQGTFSNGPNAISSASVAGVPMRASQLQASSLPFAIVALTAHEGRLFAATYDAAADVSMVWYSAPFAYHWFHPSQDFIPVPGRVLDLGSTTEGLLIGSSRQILLRGADGVLVTLADYGVVPGRAFAQDLDGITALWTQRGAATFPPYKLLSDGKVSLAPGETCATEIIYRRGLKQLIVLTDDHGEPFNPYS